MYKTETFTNKGEKTVFALVTELIGEENYRLFDKLNRNTISYRYNTWKHLNKGEYFIFAEASTGNNFLTNKGNSRQIEILIITPKGLPIYIDAKGFNKGSKSFLSDTFKDIIDANKVGAEVIFAFVGDVTETVTFQTIKENLKIPKNVTVTDNLKQLKKKLKKLLF